MNGNKALLDSNVIIEASKGVISINSNIKKHKYLYISIISYIEVKGFNFSNIDEKSAIESILKIIPTINLDLQISEIAINLRKIRKVKLPDAIILATAKSMNAPIITKNINDFINIDNAIEIFHPNIYYESL